MPSPNGYILSALADSDLEEIFDYSTEKFGVNQAVKYLLEFEALFLKFVTNPEIGRSRDEIAPGLKSYPKSSHVVFYRRQNKQILIVRILHGSRDLMRFFDE
jgi:toxin ParE1/3/4